jgi:hypothetical protein
MKKLEVILLKKVGLFFLFILVNVIPTRINLYEQIINFIEQDIQQSNLFYYPLIILIGLFRVMVILLPIYEAYDIYRYNKKHKIFYR